MAPSSRPPSRRRRLVLAAAFLVSSGWASAAGGAPPAPAGTPAALAGTPAAPAGTPAGTPAQEDYTVFLCPMHRDRQAAGPSRCAICGMAMVRRTLTTRYVCLADETDAVVSETPGTCPSTGEPLAPTTREVVWFCPDAPDRLFPEPGECEGGAPRDRTTRRAEHGDHNPRHGGVLFMAPDGVHHLEGALVDGAFRLYFYDSFTRPLPPAGFRARAVPADDRGEPIGDPAPLASAPEALEMPAETDPDERASFTAFVRFPDREEEARFDFVFLPEAERARLASESAAGSTDSPSAGGLPELRIPERPEAILREIHDRDRRVRNLISAGRWADLFIPALEAKELALAYGERLGPEERPWAALKRIVRGAWLLDLHGDAGDRTRVEEAYTVFAEGMSGLPALAGAGGPR